MSIDKEVFGGDDRGPIGKGLQIGEVKKQLIAFWLRLKVGSETDGSQQSATYVLGDEIYTLDSQGELVHITPPIEEPGSPDSMDQGEPPNPWRV